jgi:hypothetical protein
MIYRLIGLWLVLLVGWVLFLVISARRARRAAAVNLTTSTPTGLDGLRPPTDRFADHRRTLRPRVSIPENVSMHH